MTAHLESLMTKELVWSGRLNLDLQNRIEDIDRVIATEIVAPIVLYLGRAEAESWGMSGHSEDEIRFREATALMAQRTLEALGQARLILSEIIRRCGEIDNVYVALARAEHSHGLLLAGEPFIESLERAWEYAKKATSIDDLNSRAHAELALQEMFLKRQDSAAEIYRHAMKLNPYDPMLRADWADCLVNLGRAQEAVPILQDVLSGWPKDRVWVEWNLCDAYWALGEPERIVALLKRQPDLPHVHRLFAASYAKLGNLKEAKHHVEKVCQHQPGFSTKEWGRLVPVATSDAAEEYVDHLERAGL